MLDWNSGYNAQIGYVTTNDWWNGSYRDFYYGYTLPGVNVANYLWDPGSPGTYHTFYIMWDNNNQVYDFTIDASTWTSPSTSVVGFVASYAGITDVPTVVDGSAPSDRWDLFDWASMSQWYWHGGWPSPTYNFGPDASGLPQNGYTDVWY